jgi:hypothetical protein
MGWAGPHAVERTATRVASASTDDTCPYSTSTSLGVVDLFFLTFVLVVAEHPVPGVVLFVG